MIEVGTKVATRSGKVRGTVVRYDKVRAPSGDLVEVVQIERPRGGLVWELRSAVVEDEK